MSFPAAGSYFSFCLDPVASLHDIEDKQVSEDAGRLTTREYVAWPVGVPQPPPAYEVAYIDLVQQGRPPEMPAEFSESRMCVPIRPNTQHPEGRRPAHCCHPLPWDGCYHAALHRTRVRIKTEVRPIDPPHSLGPAERVLLKFMLQDDERRRERLRSCAAEGVAPPPAEPSDCTVSATRSADRELSDVPYWQIRAAERAEHLANPPTEATYHMKLKPNWDAESDSSDYSVSEDDSHNTSAAQGSALPRENAHDNAATNAAATADHIADMEDVILTALNHRADLRDLSPVIVPLSYDLSTLAAPPSPTGFMEELDAIRKIRSDYEERIRRLKDEVRRRDDEYMSDIEARREKQSPARSKWSVPSSFAPFANKLKARLASLRYRPMPPASTSPLEVKPRKPRLLILTSVWRPSKA